MQETAPSHLPAEVQAQLRGVFAQFPGITLAVLFGSVAAGRARVDSDLDLAVLAARNPSCSPPDA